MIYITRGFYQHQVGNLNELKDFDNFHQNAGIVSEEYKLDRYCCKCTPNSSNVNRKGKILLDFCKESRIRIMNIRDGEEKYAYVVQIAAG